MKWKVSLTGQTTGSKYVYEVDGPNDAQREEVEQAALAAHGRNIVSGTVDEVVYPVIAIDPPR